MGPQQHKTARAKDSVIALFSMFGGNYLPERCSLTKDDSVKSHSSHATKSFVTTDKKNASVN